MKRFTETNKWDDKWFRGLSPAHKLIYLFMLDVCDHAGFWEIDIEGAAFKTRLPSDKISPIFEGLNKSQEGLSKVLIKRGGYVWIKDFLSDQNNLPLNPLNNSHKKAMSCIGYRPEFEEAELLLPDEDIGERARVNQKEAVWVRDRGICLYCNTKIATLKDYELDHIVPRASHVSEVYTNFATACRPCNQRKRDKIVDLTVGDFSSAEAKKALKDDPSLLLEFNSFFDRRLRIQGNSLTELGASNAPNISPIGKGIGKSKGKGRVKENSELMIRMGSWFGRKPETLWDEKEAQALKHANPTEAEIDGMESYYQAEIPKKDDIRRRDLQTLLNNWSGELDRARTYLNQ